MTDQPMPQRSTDLRERRRRETVTGIADAALTLFEERGMAATTVHDIALAAGISDRTCFRHLSSKEQSVLTLQAEFDAARDRWLERVDRDAPALGQLEAVYSEVLAALDGPLADVAEQQLRVRRLMCTEPALRAAAVSLDATRSWDSAPRVAAAFDGALTVAETRLVIEYAGVALRLAFDAWAEARDAGLPATLTAAYDSTRARLAEVAAGARAVAASR
jgi:AcrR family transcriptional regulator